MLQGSRWIGRKIAGYLARQNGVLKSLPASPDRLQQILQPCDVLLVEGDTRLSTAIKYLTQSTWSHAALYVGGSVPELESVDSQHVLIEAHIVEGVRAVSLRKYSAMHTRVARPVGLSAEDRRQVIGFVVDRLEYRYDFKNIVDLARYLLPTPPVPARWRRRMLALGSGDPTRTICSTLIAQAFELVHYPILPLISREQLTTPQCSDCYRELLHIRHHSLFTPRDFDVSPYFQIIKPTLAAEFDYRTLEWSKEDLTSGTSVAVHME